MRVERGCSENAGTGWLGGWGDASERGLEGVGLTWSSQAVPGSSEICGIRASASLNSVRMLTLMRVQRSLGGYRGLTQG